MAWLLRISANGTGYSPLDDELLASRLWDLGTTGLYQDGGGETVAGFQTRDDAATVAAVLGRTAGQWTVSIEPAADFAAANGDGPVPVAITIAGKTTDLMIEAGGAFGHGGHDTTRLALDLLLAQVRAGDRMLDVGTGTGILAIAAATAGAGAVIGIDNDPVAIEIASSNMARNADRATDRDTGSMVAGDMTVARAVAELGGAADLVVMNVLLPVHRELAASVVDGLGPEARLITAGYLEEQRDELLDLYRPLLSDRQLGHQQRRLRNGWAADLFA